MEFLTNITMYLKGLGKQKQQYKQSQQKEKFFSKNYTDGRWSFHIHRLAENQKYVYSTKSHPLCQYNPHQYTQTDSYRSIKNKNSQRNQSQEE